MQPLYGEAIPTSKKQKVKSLAPIVALSPGINKSTRPLESTCVEEAAFCWDVRISLSVIGFGIGRLSKHEARVGTNPAGMASR